MHCSKRPPIYINHRALKESFSELTMPQASHCLKEISSRTLPFPHA